MIALPFALHFCKTAGGLFVFLAEPPDFHGLRLFLRIFKRQRKMPRIERRRIHGNDANHPYAHQQRQNDSAMLV